MHDSLPQGCIDEGCDGAAMRGSSPTSDALFVVAGLMLAISSLCLLLLARRAGGLGRLGAVAGDAGAVGLVLLAAAAIVSAVDNGWNGMPALVVPGVVLLAVALVLLAWVALRARLLPMWVSLPLLATALVLPFANEQTSRILIAVPFGVVWCVAGAVLLVRAPDTAVADSR